MAKVKFYRGGLARVTREITESGFGPGTEADVIKNYMTFTVVKPGATLGQLEHSLEIQLDDVRLRLGKRKLREVLRED